MTMQFIILASTIILVILVAVLLGITVEVRSLLKRTDEKTSRLFKVSDEIDRHIERAYKRTRVDAAPNGSIVFSQGWEKLRLNSLRKYMLMLVRTGGEYELQLWIGELSYHKEIVSAIYEQQRLKGTTLAIPCGGGRVWWYELGVDHDEIPVYEMKLCGTSGDFGKPIAPVRVKEMVQGFVLTQPVLQNDAGAQYRVVKATVSD